MLQMAEIVDRIKKSSKSTASGQQMNEHKCQSSDLLLFYMEKYWVGQKVCSGFSATNLCQNSNKVFANPI